MQSTFLLDVIIRKRTSILELFASKDQPLLIRWNAFLILDLALDIINRIRTLHFKGNCLPRQSFDKNLHSSSQTQHQMQRTFLLNIII